MPKPLFTLTLTLLFMASNAFAGGYAALEAAKKKYVAAGKTEAAEATYVATLAALLGEEVEAHMHYGGHVEQAKALNAELRHFALPENSDGKALSKLLVGRWQSPRHTYIVEANGRWKFAPEDGDTHGTWKIKGNQYTQDDMHYTIVLLNKDYFVFKDGENVFFEHRL